MIIIKIQETQDSCCEKKQTEKEIGKNVINTDDMKTKQITKRSEKLPWLQNSNHVIVGQGKKLKKKV